MVRVEAAALNFFDTLIIAGKYQTQAGLPVLAGGRIRRHRRKPRRRRDRSLASATASSAIPAMAPRARRIALAADKLVAIPDRPRLRPRRRPLRHLRHTLYALKDRAQLKAGETLAVLGASGGVGLAASSSARLMGARVIACASSRRQDSPSRASTAPTTASTTPRRI